LFFYAQLYHETYKINLLVKYKLFYTSLKNVLGSDDYQGHNAGGRTSNSSQILLQGCFTIEDYKKISLVFMHNST
jgi:hypothetical protein